MSWCDKLASIPTIGLRLQPHFISADSILSAISPLLNDLANDEAPEFSTEIGDAYSCKIVGNDGFTLDVTPYKINVSFAHKIGWKATSGSLPVMNILSDTAPYTELLDRCADRLEKLCSLLPDIRARQLSRIGIVTATQVELSDAPPGLRRLVEYYEAPWKGVDALGINVASLIDTREGWTDRCIHQIGKPESADKIPTFSFDWQRLYSPTRKIGAANLGHLIKQARQEALDYFEWLGQEGLPNEFPNRSSGELPVPNNSGSAG